MFIPGCLSTAGMGSGPPPPIILREGRKDELFFISFVGSCCSCMWAPPFPDSVSASVFERVGCCSCGYAGGRMCVRMGHSVCQACRWRFWCAWWVVYIAMGFSCSGGLLKPHLQVYVYLLIHLVFVGWQLLGL